jgi:hypothetical protein
VKYNNVENAFHELGRELEAYEQEQHALAARTDAVHLRARYKRLAALLAEYALEARQDADRLNQRAQRHLRMLAKGAAND